MIETLSLSSFLPDESINFDSRLRCKNNDSSPMRQKLMVQWITISCWNHQKKSPWVFIRRPVQYRSKGGVSTYPTVYICLGVGSTEKLKLNFKLKLLETYFKNTLEYAFAPKSSGRSREGPDRRSPRTKKVCIESIPYSPFVSFSHFEKWLHPSVHWCWQSCKYHQQNSKMPIHINKNRWMKWKLLFRIYWKR